MTYLQLQNTSGQTLWTCHGQGQVGPLKTTIPQLEFSAATISVKLDKMMHQQMSLPLQESVYWSDSMIVLQYLRNEDKWFQTFVTN